MLLTGTYSRTLDDKQRLTIPRTLREVMGERHGGVLYVTPDCDGSLALYPTVTFDALAGRLDAASPGTSEVRDYRRLFYARATRVELDGQSRLRIPSELVELAQLTKEVVLLGVQDHLELWDSARWEAYLADRQARYDEIADKAFVMRNRSE